MNRVYLAQKVKSQIFIYNFSQDIGNVLILSGLQMSCGYSLRGAVQLRGQQRQRAELRAAAEKISTYMMWTTAPQPLKASLSIDASRH